MSETEYRVGSGWTNVWSGIQSLSKGRNGVVDVLFSGGSAFEHGSFGWNYLAGGVAEAV